MNFPPKVLGRAWFNLNMTLVGVKHFKDTPHEISLMLSFHRIHLMGHRHTYRCSEKQVASRCNAAEEIQGHCALHHAKLQDRGNTCKSLNYVIQYLSKVQNKVSMQQLQD